jgi:hypothetical protein
VVNGGKRQGSFMGEHDLAALSTMALVLGLAYLFHRDRRPPAVGLVGIVVGALGIVLGASLASVLGLYLGAVAMVALALVRRDLRRRAVLVTVLICAAVTGRDLRPAQRRSRLSPVLVRPPPETPGQYAASWSHRLIYVYIGGRVLPRPTRFSARAGRASCRPHDYAQYLSDARERFLRPAAALLPAGDRHADPAADLGSGPLRAGTRRSGALRRPRRPRDPRRGRGRPPPRPGEPWGEQAYVPLGLAGGDRRGDRRRCALRRLAAGCALLAGARRRCGPARRRAWCGEPLDRARDRTPERRWRGAPRAPARARADAPRARRRRRRGTLAAGEESMEYVADELGVRLVGCPSLQRELSPRADPAAILALRRIIRQAAPGRRPHAHGEGGATGRLAAVASGRARPRAIVHTYHGHVLSGYFSRRWERVFR